MLQKDLFILKYLFFFHSTTKLVDWGDLKDFFKQNIFIWHKENYINKALHLLAAYNNVVSETWMR